jgi:hypothetical protein
MTGELTSSHRLANIIIMAVLNGKSSLKQKLQFFFSRKKKEGRMPPLPGEWRLIKARSRLEAMVETF